MFFRRFAPLAGTAASALMFSAAVAQYNPIDPPRTHVEDTTERYRALRAADKPHAETSLDSVEVGEGEGLRAIEPLDPTLDPSSQHVAPPGGPQDDRIVRGSLPIGFDQVIVAEPERVRFVRVADGYESRIDAIVTRIARLEREAIRLEALAAVSVEADATVVPQRRSAGYRPVDVATDPPAVVVEEEAIIPADSLKVSIGDLRDEIAVLHRKAVRLEAQKLADLEGLLTADQIRSVRAYRVKVLNAPPARVPARAVRPVAPVTPAVPVERDVDVDDGDVEVKEEYRTPDGGELKIESENGRIEKIESDD